MRKLAPGLALMLAGCWQVAVVGDELTTGGSSSTGGRSTSGSSGTGGRSTGGSTGRSTSGTSSGTGASDVCGPCAPGATCDGGVCVCPGATDGTCPPSTSDESFCFEGTCSWCYVHKGGTLEGDQCRMQLEIVGDSSPGCIAVDSTEVYWNDTTGLEKVPIEDMTKNSPGGSPQTLYLNQGDQRIVCLAIDDTDVYLTVSDGTIRRVPKTSFDGGAIPPIASGQDAPQGIAVDRFNVYWTNSGSNEVMRLEKTAASVQPTVIATLGNVSEGPNAIAVDSNNVYWTDYEGSNVMMVPIDGGVATTIAINQELPSAIAVDGTNVYWTNQGTSESTGQVVKQLLAGAFDGGTVLAARQQQPSGIAVDGTNVYWTNYSGDSVNFVPIAGGEPGPVFPIATNDPIGIAVDSNSLYWTSSPPTVYNGAVYQLTPK